SDTCTAPYEVKRSTFTSYLVPYPLFEQTLRALQEAHPKANHIVWAYRYLNNYDQIVENSTDDGEPKGCAGNPTLAQLRGVDLINTALLTIRYFGGIKLGTGGMVRAYGEAAKKVIEKANLLPYIKREPLQLEIAYPLIKRYEHFFKTEGIDAARREFTQEGVIWRLALSAEEKEKLLRFEASLL
ncbi:MAG TPA: YigZ family protein, partial [Campylobacteraceae bacterium]|nr:YigZ family protein [Campylobacteraceae bacterium]